MKATNEPNEPKERIVNAIITSTDNLPKHQQRGDCPISQLNVDDLRFSANIKRNLQDFDVIVVRENREGVRESSPGIFVLRDNLGVLDKEKPYTETGLTAALYQYATERNLSIGTSYH